MRKDMDYYLEEIRQHFTVGFLHRIAWITTGWAIPCWLSVFNGWPKGDPLYFALFYTALAVYAFWKGPTIIRKTKIPEED